MDPLIRSRRPCAALAAGVLLAAACGAQAASTAADVSRVHITGQVPLRDACPSVDERDLADQLVPAWEAAARPSTVAVSFRVQGHRVHDVAPDTDSPRLYHQIRRVVHGLDCTSGDAPSRNVRFLVRFVDGTPGDGAAAVTLADVAAAGR